MEVELVAFPAVDDRDGKKCGCNSKKAIGCDPTLFKMEIALAGLVMHINNIGLRKIACDYIRAVNELVNGVSVQVLPLCTIGSSAFSMSSAITEQKGKHLSFVYLYPHAYTLLSSIER